MAGFNSTLRQGNITHHEYIQLTVLTVYIFLYGKAYLALSGVGETIQVRAKIMNNTALSAAMNTQFLLQIGIFTAIPMILGFILEQGFLKVGGCAVVDRVPGLWDRGRLQGLDELAPLQRWYRGKGGRELGSLVG
ncbi:hypothetical protein SAY86_025886 [Trapa natans]|uniref:Uncharacterized protein n=1 Tax=Trapa natans TaxID=22666 RepID=A0AAN7KIT8_TRANT|nr:hypothetical protein SAY86_025886 [Trapa natans]